MSDRIVTSVSDRRETVVDVIRRAEKRLALSLFRCNDDEIFDELARAVSRGVSVEVLTTSRAKGGRKRLEKLWKSLSQTGATVHAYHDPVVKYHAKYLVADDGPAVVASLNFTRKCFTRTWDALVVTDDSDVVAGLQRLFAADRDGSQLPEGLSPRLIIGPERARRQLTSLILEAQESIRLVDAKVSDPELVTLLTDRRNRGVRVEIFGAKHVGELKSHGKVMVIDARRAIIGSLALSALSLEFRREVAIVVDDAKAVAGLDLLFDTLPPVVSTVNDVQADARGGALC